MKTTAVIETGPGGGFDIVLMDLEHHVIFGDGDTVQEAKEDLLNSYQEVLDYFKEGGDIVFIHKFQILEFLGNGFPLFFKIV